MGLRVRRHHEGAKGQKVGLLRRWQSIVVAAIVCGARRRSGTIYPRSLLLLLLPLSIFPFLIRFRNSGKKICLISSPPDNVPVVRIIHLLLHAYYTNVTHMLCTCYAHVKGMIHSHYAPVTLMLRACYTHVTHLLRSCYAPATFMLHLCYAHAKHTLHSC